MSSKICRKRRRERSAVEARDDGGRMLGSSSRRQYAQRLSIAHPTFGDEKGCDENNAGTTRGRPRRGGMAGRRGTAGNSARGRRGLSRARPTSTDERDISESPSQLGSPMTIINADERSTLCELNDLECSGNILFSSSKPASPTREDFKIATRGRARRGGAARRGTRGRSGFSMAHPAFIDVTLECDESAKESRDPLKEEMPSASYHGSEEECDNEHDCENVLNPYPYIPRLVKEMCMDYEEEEPPLGEGTLFPHPFSAADVDASTPSLLSSALLSQLSSNQPLVPSNDFFDFQWKSFPSPQVPSDSRREKFSISNQGPTDRYADPYAAFAAIWDRQIMEQVCEQTNIYAQQYANRLMISGYLTPCSRITKWHDVECDELYVFFAILIAMGIVVKPQNSDYWSMTENMFVTPGFSAHMTRDRFLLLHKCLRFNTNLMHTEAQTQPQAQLLKVQPIVDHLNMKFSQLYNLDQNIALDESLTQFVNPFTSNKAAPVSIRTCELCECSTGYLWSFHVYAGSDPAQDSGSISETSASMVLRLLDGLENKGHTVWLDSYYNSPALARVLKANNFDCVGKLKTNRKFVPEQLSTLKNTDMERGQIAGCTSGDVDLLVWRDVKLVGLVSTYHGPAFTQGGQGPKPTLVRDYNISMGGVDKKHRMLASYSMEQKRSRIWHKAIFRRLLNISVLNAFILYKHHTKSAKHRDFRMKLTDQLLQHHYKRWPVIFVRDLWKLNKFPTHIMDHLPALYGSVSEGKRRLRRGCVVCKRRTNTYCPACNVALCCFRRDDSCSIFSCFRTHHT